MDIDRLTKMLDEFFDQALVFHAFTPYMRDYELIVYATADPITGIQPAYQRFLFRYCTEATTRSMVPEEIWRRSLDERLIRHETGRDLDGFVWGVNWQCLYPGMRLVGESESAARWQRALGLDFHEVKITTEAQEITLVFSELVITEVPMGYVPFVADP